jgi:hypothetical protein
VSGLWVNGFLWNAVFALLCLAGPFCIGARGQTLTVSATPSSVNFTLPRNGVASGTSQITITTQWLVSVPPLTITLYAFTGSTTAALTDGAGHNIPTSKVSGSANGGSFTSFTGTSSFAAGRSITIFTQSTLSIAGSRNDTLGLRIDTTSLALPPATYQGTLTIRATLM